MLQESTLDKQHAGKKIVDSDFMIWLKNRLHPLMMLLAGTVVTCKVDTINQYTPLPDKPIIFAANHSAFLDTPIALRAVQRRSYIFAGKQRLRFTDWLFFVLNGTIWVDRGSKEDMAASKDGLLGYLAKGQSILWFPEGTWNLTANQLVMPLKWGIIETARQAGAQIIPVALDYNWEENHCKVKFGAPVSGSVLENKSEAIRNLRDTMATLRWDMMCQSPVLHRAEVTPEKLKAQMYRVLDAYPALEWERERSYIYQPYEQVALTPQALIPCWENAFLFRER